MGEWKRAKRVAVIGCVLGAWLAMSAVAPAPAAAAAAPTLEVLASYEHPNVHQYRVRAKGVDISHKYDIVQHGGWIVPFTWTCYPENYTAVDPACKATRVCSVQTPCDDPAPTWDDMRQADRFDLVDLTLGETVASIDMLSADLRFDRARDELTGRASPSRDFTVHIQPADEALSGVSQDLTTDLSGLVNADFGPESATPYDVRGWDRVTLENVDAEGDTWRYFVHQPRIMWAAGTNWVTVWGKPEGYVTFQVLAPDGSRRGTVKGSGGGDQGSARLDVVPEPGDRILLEDNGGVRHAEMLVPELSGRLQYPSLAATGIAKAPPGSEWSGHQLWLQSDDLYPGRPGAGRVVNPGPDGAFTAPTDASVASVGSAFARSIGYWETNLRLGTPDDHAVALSTAVPGFLLNLETGAIQVWAFAHFPEQCPTIHASNGATVTKLSRSYCEGKISPIPEAGDRLEARGPDGELVTAATVPEMRVDIDRDTNTLSLYADAGLVSAPYLRHVRPAIVDPGGAFSRSYSGTSCRPAGAAMCAVTPAAGLLDGDRIEATVHAIDHPRSVFIRDIELRPPLRMRYDTDTGQIAALPADTGTWGIRVVSPEGNVRGTWTDEVGSEAKVLTDLVGAGGIPVPAAGDRIEAHFGGALIHSMVVTPPQVHIDREAGQLSGSSTAPGTLYWSMSRGSWEGPSVTPDADGAFTVGQQVPRCNSAFVTHVSPQLDRTVASATNWCFIAWVRQRSSALLETYGAVAGLDRVTVRRGGKVIGRLDLPRVWWSRFAIPGLDQLESGDELIFSGDHGPIQFELPPYTGYMDIGDDRIAGVTLPNTKIDVYAANGSTWTPHYLTTNAAGRYVAQFGNHAEQAADIDEATSTHAQIHVDSNRSWFPPQIAWTSTNLSTGHITWNDMRPGQYTARLICGTAVDSVPFSVAAATGKLHVSAFTRLQLQPGCVLATADHTGGTVFTTEVPTLEGNVGGSDHRSLSVHSEPNATLTVTLDGARRTLRTDAAGDGGLRTGSPPRNTWLSLRDRHWSVWYRYVPSSADQTVGEIDDDGAAVARPDGVGVSVPPDIYTGNFLYVDPNDHPMDRVAVEGAQARGFAAGSLFVNVTIADAGQMHELDVHDLDVPIRIVVPVPASNRARDDQLAPAWFSNGTWRLSPKISPGILPRELRDGYWIRHLSDGSRQVIFLSRHLTEFGVLRDVRGPKWRRRAVRAKLVSRRRVGVRWKRPADASQIRVYRVQFGRKTVARVRTRRAVVTHWVRVPRQRRLPRKVCVVAIDMSGNASRSCTLLKRRG